MRYAKGDYQFIGGQRSNSAQGSVAKYTEPRRVYNIEVEQMHEYFANGVLVKNCSDAFDYFICEDFKSIYYAVN